MDFALSIVEQGLIYGILALGVYITYKILDSGGSSGGCLHWFDSCEM